MSTGIIITGLSCKINAVSEIVKRHLLQKLYIHVSEPRIQITTAICNQIVDLYSSSQFLLPNVDVRIIVEEIKNSQRGSFLSKFKFDVVILPKKFSCVSLLVGGNKQPNVIIVDDFEENNADLAELPLKLYENVVLGGTFDRLHTGHKILLTEAIMRCTRKLTVGVTDTCMLQGKKLWEIIEPCEKRIADVKQFVKDVDQSIECEVVPIQDMYGPTKDDPTFNMIVVSEETLRGGAKVNETRLNNGLQPLEVHCVRLLANPLRELEEEDKISSSNSRMKLLGTRLKQPVSTPDLPEEPYIIGLTGGIASGKSSIGKKLESLGAGLVDCDKVAHALYRQGSDIYHKIVETFGKEIIGDDREINRRKLGAIVFSDKNQLEKLNCLLWPNILKEALKECSRLHKEEGKAVVVMEAAVLLRAGWQRSVHEVWTSIITPQEAISRLVKRNGLDETAAKERLASQPSNSEQVAIANVVFSSQWSVEFTHSQVERAWTLVANKQTVSSSPPSKLVKTD